MGISKQGIPHPLWLSIVAESKNVKVKEMNTEIQDESDRIL
jgi:hypothetical protein